MQREGITPKGLAEASKLSIGTINNLRKKNNKCKIETKVQALKSLNELCNGKYTYEKVFND